MINKTNISIISSLLILLTLFFTPTVLADAVTVDYFVDSTQKTMQIGDSIQLAKPVAVTQDKTDRLFEKGVTEYLYELHQFDETVTFTLNKVHGTKYYFSYVVSYNWRKTDHTKYELPLHWYGLVNYWHNLTDGTSRVGEFVAVDKTNTWTDENGKTHNSLVYESDEENSIMFTSYRYRITPNRAVTNGESIVSDIILLSGKNYSTTKGRALKQECEWSLKNTSIRQNVTYVENYSSYQSKRIVLDYCHGEEKYTVRKARCYLLVKDHDGYNCPREHRCHEGICIPQEEYDSIGIHAVMYEPGIEDIVESWVTTPENANPPSPPGVPIEPVEEEENKIENSTSEAILETENKKGFFASIWTAISSIFS